MVEADVEKLYAIAEGKLINGYTRNKVNRKASQRACQNTLEQTALKLTEKARKAYNTVCENVIQHNGKQAAVNRNTVAGYKKFNHSEYKAGGQGPFHIQAPAHQEQGKHNKIDASSENPQIDSERRKL